MTKTRFQFDVTESRVEELRELMRDCGIETNKELFNNALTLLEWAVDEAKKGNTIASVNEAEKVYRELQMPILRRAAASGDRRKNTSNASNRQKAGLRSQHA